LEVGEVGVGRERGGGRGEGGRERGEGREGGKREKRQETETVG